MPMASFLANLERFLERALEAPTRRLFRTRLQPVELARALGRAMAAESQVGPGGLQVPNRYRIGLHPADHRAFLAWRGALEAELAGYVEQTAQARGWRVPGRPRVEVYEAPAAPRGRPLVESTTADEAASDGDRTLREPPLVADGTAVLERTAVAPARTTQRAPLAVLDLPDGGSVALAQRVVRLGRALDNDVAIEHDSVSRYHAEIRRAGGQYVLVDLGSTNGTRVEGQAIRERALRSGETIHLGAVPLRFMLRG
jgi:hypothetical protein